ncbi:hypothetical protein F5B22DRAFT_261877 [Xylaria bambusicola]|uniref:uncharacterized protein n=1 Tax=Xylaria bambusicola TaxID=326684 RepID=UPI002008B7C1|nr:uncharacterized protein F5B22DRAFT_261877 [Xylaria bambusicola]KAI0525968.1 hypothetical protein F5B22DRAFT_261877 [Xylaria bambusicola]
MARRKFYGVRTGRVSGVYDNWEDCRAQVEKCRNDYRGFDTRDEAAFYVATGQTCNNADGRALFARWKCDQPTTSRAITNDIKKEDKPRIKTEAFDSSQSYFSQIPHFKPDDNADFEDEFSRFASSQNIEPGSNEWRQKRTQAVRHELMFHYSQNNDSDDEDNIKEEDEDNLHISEEERARRWKLLVFQNMCREAKLEPLDTIEGCVANLKGELINIVDYIDSKRSGRPIYVWPPHLFEEFRAYTPSDTKRMHYKTVIQGDRLLEPLLQVLRSRKAAAEHQRRRGRAVVARQDCASRTLAKTFREEVQQRLPVIKEEPRPDIEVLSIHGTESNCSSPATPIKDNDDVPPWSPSSIGSSVVEILLTQTAMKRDLDDFAEEQDGSENEVILMSVNKRARV